MSDKKSNPFPGIDWLLTQQNYMDAWKSFNQFMPKAGYPEHNSLANAWTDAMENWWRTVSPAAPDGSQEFMTKMMEQGKMFYMLGEQFSGFLNSIIDNGKTKDNWETQFNSLFGEMKNMLENTSSNPWGVMHGMLGAWQLLPLDTLQRTLSSSSVMPGDFLANTKPDAFNSVTDKFLSIPGVGYTRESQEQFQRGLKLLREYQETCNEYNKLMCRISITALDCMQIRIQKLAEEGKELKSLREIYDLWVDCNEEAYAELAYSEEFSELYGRLTNTLMAIKLHGRNLIDETLSALNMPTTKGMNSVKMRQQELRREYKTATRKIQDLEEELSDLRKMVSNTRVTSTAPSSSTGNKRTNVKKTEKKGTKAVKSVNKKAGKNKVVKAKEKKRTKKKSKKKVRNNQNKDNMIVIKI